MAASRRTSGRPRHGLQPLLVLGHDRVELPRAGRHLIDAACLVDLAPVSVVRRPMYVAGDPDRADDPPWEWVKHDDALRALLYAPYE